MKLSVITDEISQDFDYALDVMLEYGVSSAELRGLWGTNITELDKDQIKRAKQSLKEREMVVSCLSSPFYKCDIATEDATVRGPLHLASAVRLSEQIEMLHTLCIHAHEFDTQLIRVFTFWRNGELTPEIEEQIVESFSEPVRIAREEGVVLALENEHACYIGTGAEAARIISAIDSPVVRACWDPGNAFFAGERVFPDGYQAIKPYLAHFHVKDAAKDPTTGQPVWRAVGEGELDYACQFNALQNDHYQGYISLETHYVPLNGTPEDGSRASLAGIMRLLKD